MFVTMRADNSPGCHFTLAITQRGSASGECGISFATFVQPFW
jgi:hypothetical protein